MLVNLMTFLTQSAILLFTAIRCCRWGWRYFVDTGANMATSNQQVSLSLSLSLSPSVGCRHRRRPNEGRRSRLLPLPFEGRLPNKVCMYLFISLNMQSVICGILWCFECVFLSIAFSWVYFFLARYYEDMSLPLSLDAKLFLVIH
ncbi:unnamed protein product [Musa acuminata var. zebrina]